MAIYQTINRNAQIFSRSTRFVNMMDLRRTTQVDVDEVRSNIPTVQLDRAELDRLLSECKK